MKRVKASAIQVAHTFQQSVNVAQVRFEWGELVVSLLSAGDRKAATVRFSEASGFRLLDEGDLLEFWPACAKDNGWLFVVHENGWFDLELSRSGFLRDKSLGEAEYFIASENHCVSILSSAPPDVIVYSV